MAKRRRISIPLVFSLLGGLLVLFVILPLAATLLSTSPQVLGETLLDRQVLRFKEKKSSHRVNGGKGATEAE